MEVLSLLAGLAIAVVIIARPAKPYFKRPSVETVTPLVHEIPKAGRMARNLSRLRPALVFPRAAF